MNFASFSAKDRESESKNIKKSYQLSHSLQVLQCRWGLRQRLLLPYVPLPGIGSVNVPAWNDLFRNSLID